MHWENLEPVLSAWPMLLGVIGLTALALAGAIWLFGRSERQLRERRQRYWTQELRWRGQIKIRQLLDRIRTPRLTDQRERGD